MSQYPTPSPRVAGQARHRFNSTRSQLSTPPGPQTEPDPVIAQPTLQPFFSGSDRSPFPGPLETSFRYTGGNRAEFYRYLRDRLPIVSAGVWSWVHLCATPLDRRIEGSGHHVRAAERRLEELENRLRPYPGRLAFDRLTEALFWELFTLGRSAAELIPLPDLSGVAEVRFVDPFRIQHGVDGNKYYIGNDYKLSRIPPDRIFYAVLQHDPAQPAGIEPLATLPFVLAIENQLLEDMARSSHNTGSPRLQIKIAPPPRDAAESSEEFETRAQRYFDDTVSGFSKLEPDDNLFTWNDIDVMVVGGDGSQKSNWRINRQEVIEDVVTGLKLFPWVLGRSHGTTKNWVEAQYNLLMHIVNSLQLRGLQLAERIANIDLALAGIPVKVKYSYTPHTDPYALQREQAQALKVETLLKLAENGMLTKDELRKQLKV